MSTQKVKQLLPLFMVFFIVALSSLTVQAAVPSSLEIGEVRSIGREARVPVTVVNTTYLTSGQVEISLPNHTKTATLKKFEPTDVFDGELFRTISSFSGNTLKIDFQSQTSKEHNLNNEPTIIGYISYELSKDFVAGDSIKLEISSLVAKGRSGTDLILQSLPGKIDHKMPIGDVVGNNKPTVAGAMRVLQHINGNTITDREAQLSADVDKDGVLTQSDAQQILDFTTGKRTSFLAIEAQELDTAVLKSEYSEKVEAFHGREPYEYKRKLGSLPTGVNLNTATGELSGSPTIAKSYSFTIQVTDALGNTADRAFTLDVMDSNIISVEKLTPINVKVGEKPSLPSEVTVTYKDKTKGKEKVQWDTVDTSVMGEITAKGVIGDSGFKVTVIVQVVNTNYINHINVGYFQILNFHTITIDVNSEVYIVNVNGLNAHYEGDNQFSLASSSLTSGATVPVKVYDKYGNLLETKMQKLVVN